jgi:2-polyprenyl-3-methyl-5-hydroxy-6-metoxy-1,4-benzoquinol methylase
MDADLAEQQRAWDSWLAGTRIGQSETSRRSGQTAARAMAVVAELAKLPPIPDRSILDVGCGDGYDSVLFAKFGRVVATDLAPATIDDAAKRYSGAGVTFLAGDFLTMELPDAPFDVVVTLETLSHVYDQAAFVRRCADLLKPGGQLVITTQNKAIYDYGGHGAPRGYLRRWLTQREVRELMRPRFERIRIRTIVPPTPGTRRASLDGKPPPLWMLVAYSYRLNRLLSKVIPQRQLDRAKERLGIAQTIVAVGTRR